MKEPAADVVIAGKYCLEGQLAAGGMGSVWVARHIDLQVPVAIKFMDGELATTDEGRVRFEREAKAAAFLQSPNVVNVQDYGIDEGLPYIVMELLNGEDLKDRIHRLGRLSLEEMLPILQQTAKALRRAQEIGIVHRDIKPENLFIATGDDGDEIVKVLDFGIAKETGPVLLAKGTNTGQIIGSPHYMSPEAVRGARDIDHRSDLWSLGVIVFEAVTGQLPFQSDNVGDVMGMILADPLPRATQVAPDLPPEVDTFFERALARDRNQRFQNAREMVDAFAELTRPGGRASLASHPTPMPGTAVSERAPTLDAMPSPKAAPAPRRWGPFAAAIALLAVVGVLIAITRSGGPLGPGTPAVAAPESVSAATAAVPAPLPSSAGAAAAPAPSASVSAVPTGPAASAKGAGSKQPSGKGSAAPGAAGSSKRPWGF